MAGRLKFDRCLVIDLEMTCWDGAPPAGEIAEIIEIGLCEVDLRAGALTRSEGRLCRPDRSRISERCTQITGLDAAEMRSGHPFAQVWRGLAKRWPLRSRPTFAWGQDGPVLAAQLRADIGAEAEALLPEVHDLATVYNVIAQTRASGRPGSGSGQGIDAALAAYGLAFEGQRHRARDDAINTARILLEIARRAG